MEMLDVNLYVNQAFGSRTLDFLLWRWSLIKSNYANEEMNE